MSNNLLPLYYDESREVFDNFPPSANTGLWYNKFFNQWERKGQEWDIKKDGKDKWLKDVQNGSIGNLNLLQKNIERYIKLVDALDGELLFLKNTSSFVVGIGNAHPIENGFTWHYNLGLPYLPSSSIKGLVRAWAKNWNNSGNSQKDLIYKLLGAEKNQDSKAGDIIFFDALPLEPVRLETDIMTVHYSDYYTKGTAPGDWENPIPIPFLTVSPNQAFILGITSKNKEDNKSLDIVAEWIEKALNILGIGAKTSLGYGLFENLNRGMLPQYCLDIIIENEKIKSTKGMTSIRIEMEEDGYSDTNIQIFMESLTNKWLDRMETNKDEAQEIAKFLAKWYQKVLPEQWERPKNLKNKDKVERIKKILFN